MRPVDLVWSVKTAERLRNKVTTLFSNVDGDWSFERINSTFVTMYELVAFIPLMKVPLASGTLIRARPNYNGEVFYSQKDISFNPNKEQVRLGRFNCPQQPMFYATLRTDKSIERTAFAAGVESCKEILADSDPTKPHYYLTVGFWNIDKELNVLDLCVDEKCLLKQPILKPRVEEALKDIHHDFQSEIAALMISFITRLSEFASLETDSIEGHYWLLNCFFHSTRAYYENQKGEVIDGLIYPSCKTESDTTNIVLAPFSIEKLSLKRVYMTKVLRNPGDKMSYNVVACTNLAVVENGKWAFKFIT